VSLADATSRQEPSRRALAVPGAALARRCVEIHGALLAIVAGAALAALVLFAEPVLAWLGLGGRALTPDEHEFLRAPETLLWVFAVLVEIGAWVALGRCAAATARELPESRSAHDVLGGLVLLAVAVLLPLGLVGLDQNAGFPLPHDEAKLVAVTVAGFLVALPAIVAIWRIGRLLAPGAPELDDAALAGSPRQDTLSRFLHVRDLLDRALLILGAMVSAAILVTSALRNAVVASVAGGAERFPVEQVVLYGAFFSSVLAVLYLPVFLRLQAAGRALTASKAEVDELEARARLDGLLGLAGGTAQSLKAGLAILSPLVTSLLGTVLSGG
jgi:hypothetical protein